MAPSKTICVVTPGNDTDDVILFSRGSALFVAETPPPVFLAGLQPGSQSAGSIAVVRISAGKGQRRQAIDAARRRRTCGA